MLTPLWQDGFTYKEHQDVGINWMLSRETAATPCRGGLVCDEMGLGKTIEMVGLLKNATKTATTRHTLLVAPVAVLEQWKTVLRRSGFVIQVPRQGAWAFEGKIRMNPDGIVGVIGYEAAQRNPTLLKQIAWNRVIFDEAHRLCGDTKTTAVAESVASVSNHVWLLTATPIVNKLKNMKILLGLAGVKDLPFSNTLEAIKPFCETYVLARTMDQLRASPDGAAFPPKPQIRTKMLDFATEEEADFYRGTTGSIVKRWKAIAGDHGRDAALERLKLFLSLRQISLHPQVYIEARKKALARVGGVYARDDFLEPSTKFLALQEEVEADPGQRWIVFCHFISEMEMLKNLFDRNDSVGRVQIYNGSLTATKKEEILAATKEPLPPGKADILLVQLQSGGTGLNLQHFNRIIFTGPWWTQALMDQAIGRAVRIGQREIVQVLFLKLKEEETINIDAVMMDKAAFKGALCSFVLKHAMTQISA